MFRLFLLIYTLAGATLAGSAVVAVLTMNRFDTYSIIVAAALGALAGIPVAWVVAKKISDA